VTFGNVVLCGMWIWAYECLERDAKKSGRALCGIPTAVVQPSVSIQQSQLSWWTVPFMCFTVLCCCIAQQEVDISSAEAEVCLDLGASRSCRAAVVCVMKIHTNCLKRWPD
jgi:hypothetical protein